jgi:hypothetical protein
VRENTLWQGWSISISDHTHQQDTVYRIVQPYKAGTENTDNLLKTALQPCWHDLAESNILMECSEEIHMITLHA